MDVLLCSDGKFLVEEVNQYDSSTQYDMDISKWSHTCYHWDGSGFRCKNGCAALLNTDKNLSHYVFNYFSCGQLKKVHDDSIFDPKLPDMSSISLYNADRPPV